MKISESKNNSIIGLLPLYVELYDRLWPEMRTKINAFYETMTRELGKRGLAVTTVPVCRIKHEFEEAVKIFENEKVDAIVTLHLAYSPSLESVDALIGTKLPIIVLDTTNAYDFSFRQDEEELLYNHGIHGVQDLCSLLKRNGKQFFIEAGHWEKSDVLDRVVSSVNAARISKAMRNSRVGSIGGSFRGMGDFDVPEDILRSTIGVETINYDFNQSEYLLAEISAKEISDEIVYDNSNYLVHEINTKIHKQITTACLAVRKWIEKERLSAFTVNFLAIDLNSGLGCMPFLEASKAMARGTGYAGEGDVLTAALVGALASVYAETSFTEMFCPDWEHNSIFLSHMGEMNIDLTAEKPLLAVKAFPFTDASDTVAAFGRFKPGKAVLVNLAPSAGNTYTLIVSTVDVLDVEGEDKMSISIHGWFRPDMQISQFLEDYSRAGGTHHAVLVYGDKVREIKKFGEMMRWNLVEI